MLSKEDILTIVSDELTDSATDISLNEDAMSYYLGLPNGTEVQGRSQINSTDVADAIEWIMPQIMKSFTQNNEIVIFDPVCEGDEKQAELESEYVYEVLMKQNDGFIILHQFVKDALMQRNGILKCYYAKKTTTKSQDFTGIDENQLETLLAAEGIELLEKSEYENVELTEARNIQIAQQLEVINNQQEVHPQLAQQADALTAMAQKPIMSYDVKVSASRTKGKVYIDPVPPEEFRKNKTHNSLNLDNARFTAHVTQKTVSDLIEEFDLDLEGIKELPSGAGVYETEYRFTMQDESAFSTNTGTIDESQRLIDVSECLIKMDIDETGVAKLMKITVAGSDSPTDLISVEEVDEMPWISTTTFLMSHKFEGRSVTDRLRDLQDQKTSLWRNMFDNMYLQNNQRNLVMDNAVEMDDLLVSRPGGIIRVKRMDAVQPLATPQLGQDAYNMMDYLDRVRAGRTGVDPDGSATPSNIGDRVGSQGVDRLMNAKEELVGLIIRVMAETGLKPLCIKIRDLSTKHVDSIIDFKFRGQWHKVEPSKWHDRTTTTVRVGTGTGNHQLQVASLTQVLELQKIAKDSGSIIVSEQKTFDTIDDYCKFSGLNGAIRYFVDPSSEEGKTARKAADEMQAAEKEKNDKMEQAIAESQLKVANAEQVKAEAQSKNVMLKAQVDTQKNQITLQKQTADFEISVLTQQLAEAKAAADDATKQQELILKKYGIDVNAAVALTQIESNAGESKDKEFEDNKDGAK